MLPLIPEIIVVIVFILAGISCIVYAGTRWRRKSQAIFGWLFLPCFNVARIYILFLVNNIALADRAGAARLAFVLMGMVISVTMFVASWLNYYRK